MSPSPTNPAACPAGPSSCTVFGIPEAKLARKTAAANAAHSLRGGGLHEPKTLDDVNALVLKAGSAGQLVVIDFTATYVPPIALQSTRDWRCRLGHRLRSCLAFV